MYTKGNISSHFIGLCIGVLVIFSAGIKATAAGLILNDQSGDKGSMATFTVSIDSAPNEVAALGFDVRYDPTVLRYRDYSAGSLASGFDFFDANNASPGTVRVGGFVAGPNKINQGASGTAVSLTFEVVGQDDCQVRLAQLKDGIKGWSARPGYFTGDHVVAEELSGNPASPLKGDSLTDIRYREDTYHHQVDQPNSMAGDLDYSAYSNPDRHVGNLPTSREEIMISKNESVGKWHVSKKREGTLRAQQKSNVEQPVRMAKPRKNEYQAVSDLNNLPDRSHAGSHVKTHPVEIPYSGKTQPDIWSLLVGTMIVFGSIWYITMGLSILLVGYLFWKLMKIGRRQLIVR